MIKEKQEKTLMCTRILDVNKGKFHKWPKRVFLPALLRYRAMDGEY